MTFAVSRDHGMFEWSGDGKGIFAQSRNFFMPRHWRMIFDIIRFNTYAVDILDDSNYAKITIGEYLSTHGKIFLFLLTSWDDHCCLQTLALRDRSAGSRKQPQLP